MKRPRVYAVLAFVVVSMTQIMCGCVPSAATSNVFVYQDLNGNGKLDAGEPPFAGVKLLEGKVPGLTTSAGTAVLKDEFPGQDDCKQAAGITPSLPTGFVVSQSLVPAWDCNSIGPLFYTELKRNVVFGLAPADKVQAGTLAAQHPQITVTVVKEEPNKFNAAGQTLTVSFTFTNSGDVPLQGPPTIQDTISDASTPICDKDLSQLSVLAVGQTVTCTTFFQTSPDDLTQQSIAKPITVAASYQSVAISGQSLILFSYGDPETQTAAQTPTSTPTSPTLTMTPAAAAPVTVAADQLACRYGPGAPYLFQYGLAKGNELQLIGRYDSAFGPWVYVKYKDDPRPCWVNPKFLDLGGADISTLPSYYPDQAPLILFTDPKWVPSRFYPPKDVSADRTGNLVELSWTGLIVATGDRESPTSPRFLVEAWTCIGGKLTFTPIGVGADVQGPDLSEATFGPQVEDDAGCTEPSHAQVFLAHKDGYVGPVAFPWPGQ